jgi:hypothetical protein
MVCHHDFLDKIRRKGSIVLGLCYWWLCKNGGTEMFMDDEEREDTYGMFL